MVYKLSILFFISERRYSVECYHFQIIMQVEYLRKRNELLSPEEKDCCLTNSCNKDGHLTVASTKKDILKNETNFISHGYITYRCREEGMMIESSKTSDYKPSKKIIEVLERLKKLCTKCEKKFEDRLQACCDKLKNNKSNASRNFFDVATELFSQNIKWEQVIILIAFSGRLAVDYIIHDMMEYVECLTGWLSIFLCDRLGDWILNQNGWVRHMCVSINSKNVQSWWYLLPFLTIHGLVYIAQSLSIL